MPAMVIFDGIDQGLGPWNKQDHEWELFDKYTWRIRQNGQEQQWTQPRGGARENLEGEENQGDDKRSRKKTVEDDA